MTPAQTCRDFFTGVLSVHNVFSINLSEIKCQPFLALRLINWLLTTRFLLQNGNAREVWLRPPLLPLHRLQHEAPTQKCSRRHSQLRCSYRNKTEFGVLGLCDFPRCLTNLNSMSFLRLEAIPSRLEAIATRVEAIASRFDVFLFRRRFLPASNRAG